MAKLPDAAKRTAVLRHHEDSQQAQRLFAQQAEAEGPEAWHGDQFADEDSVEVLPSSAEHRSDTGGGDQRFSRHMLNADGRPLAAVIHRFQPPWEEAEAEDAAARRGKNYRQLAAARRQGGRSAAGGQQAEAAPTSTPWVHAEAGTAAAGSAAAAAAVAGLQGLSLRAASVPSAARPAIVWFRRDLRLADNPALHAAAASGRPVLPVFIWAVSAAGCASTNPGGAWPALLLLPVSSPCPPPPCPLRRCHAGQCCRAARASAPHLTGPLPILSQPQEHGGWPPGGAARYWLHHSLNSLDGELRRRFGSRLRCFDASRSSSAEVGVGGGPGRGFLR